MKKKIIFFTIMAVVVIGSLVVYLPAVSVMAQDETPPLTSETPVVSVTPQADESASGSATTNPSDLRKLRDRLASVVAQLRKKDEQVVVGELKAVSSATLEVDTIAGTVQTVQLDETLTKYYKISGAAKEEITQKDIKTGEYVIITGMRTEGTFSANEVYVDEPYDSKAGRVTEINSIDYSLKLETFDKETITVDIDRSVTQEILNTAGLNLEGASFTRIREGDTVHIVYPVTSIKKQVTRVTPSRILIIPLAYFNR